MSELEIVQMNILWYIPKEGIQFLCFTRDSPSLVTATSVLMVIWERLYNTALSLTGLPSWFFTLRRAVPRRTSEAIGSISDAEAYLHFSFGRKLIGSLRVSGG